MAIIVVKMSQIHTHIRGIYPFLKKHNFESFTKFKKNVFESVLIKFGLQNHWNNIKERDWTIFFLKLTLAT
ncbi:hypothetical protein LCGC14_1729440 [marine sediment metagenome]|uniref:Uncharacterized protein n=1 Tax=marine sediment metagenome TaxID=412755 RepID=A0A0F9HXV0_9ZZZZ